MISEVVKVEKHGICRVSEQNQQRNQQNVMPYNDNAIVQPFSTDNKQIASITFHLLFTRTKSASTC